MNQLAMIPPPRARKRDPETSKAAARSIEPTVGTHVYTIVACLRKRGPMTIDELSSRLPYTSEECARRLSDAERMELAVPTGLSREGLSGRKMRVWKVVR